MKRIARTSIIILLVIALTAGFAGFAFANGSDPENYRVATKDGADLALEHYRPEPTAAFNDGAQPVLIMPGMVANSNTFDVRTPAGKEALYKVKLPANLPAWAADDPFIERDHMKFYSLAYYLYDQGLDVWLANYRGQGRPPSRSYGRGDAAIDTYGIYDVETFVSKVRELTGKRPIYMGHSMGSTMIYVYLQGAKYGPEKYRRVVSDPALVTERNAGTGPGAIKGIVDLDGPVVPVFNMYPRGITWLALLPAFYLDIRPVLGLVGENVGSVGMTLLRLLAALKMILPKPIYDWISVIFSVNPANIDPNVMKYMAGYVADGIHSHSVAQYAYSLRFNNLHEYYRDGYLGWQRIMPVAPNPKDGLYSYSENMSKISLPSLVIADATYDITDPKDIEWFYNAKTRNAADKFKVMPKTAHLDVVNGLRAPYETFPLISEWISSLGSD